jgi:hypothetical protein
MTANNDVKRIEIFMVQSAKIQFDKINENINPVRKG